MSRLFWIEINDQFKQIILYSKFENLLDRCPRIQQETKSDSNSDE